MKKILIGVIIAAVIVVGGIAIYMSSSSKNSISASSQAASATAVSTATNNSNIAKINKDKTDAVNKTKTDTTAKNEVAQAKKSSDPVNSKADDTQSVKTSAIAATGKASATTGAASASVKSDTTKVVSNEKVSANINNSTSEKKEYQSTIAKVEQKASSNIIEGSTIGSNQINPGTGNFSALNGYPFMVASLSNGEQIIIPIKNAEKEGSLLVTNGYYTNNIYTPVQFKISSIGDGKYNFYQMDDGAISNDLSVVTQGGSIFTGDNINTIGNDVQSVGIQGIYQGPESDGYYPGSMLYHPFYNGTVNGSNVTLVNLGYNNYLEYREGYTSPLKINVTWNPFPDVNMQLNESSNGTPVGKFDITSFVYDSNTYSGDYYHYIRHTKAGVESRFSITGGYSPQ